MSALPLNKLEAFNYIVAEIEIGELIFPTSVNAALKLQQALDDPDCHIETAIQLVLAEPLLSARTVALANSAAFHRTGGTVITNVRTAVMRLGYKNLHTLVASMVVRNFGSKIVDPLVRAKAEQLWQHTVHVAALAKVIARRITYVNADTAIFAAIVHEVGGFYLLSRAEEFPSLLDDNPENCQASSEDIIAREVMNKLSIPEPVSSAIEALRTSLLTIPPDSLTDTLLLANHFAPVLSPLFRQATATTSQSESLLDFVANNEKLLNSIVEESAAEARSMSAALLA